MLDQNMKDQVTQVFSALDHHYTLQAIVDPKHESRSQLIEILEDVAQCSDQIITTVSDGHGLEWTILKDDHPSQILFRAVPNGHEFTTLLMAILNLDGKGKNLPDDIVANRIAALQGDIRLKSYISLTCTNCPDVVQALNIMTVLNPNIHHELIDGAINQEEAEEMGIKAVPTVFAGEKQLHVGRSTLAELLEKLEAIYDSDDLSTEDTITNYDVVVVGGGPAGVSAAVYSARKGFTVAIIADKIGGQVNETLGIENLISIPKTSGPELSAGLYEHLRDYDIDVFENRMIESVEIHEGYKHAVSSLGETFVSPSIIIATGASWKRLGVPGEEKYIGNGVAFCTHCDGPFYKGKKVVVVGGGNSGLEAAIDLSSLASHVTILEFSETLKGDQVLQDKLMKTPNVDFITSAQTEEIIGDGSKVTALRYIDRRDKEPHDISTDGVFIQIGLSPNSDIFKDIVETNRSGEILIDTHCRTQTPGVYAAGDVTVVPYKQIVVSLGEGAKAALASFEDQIKGLQVVSSETSQML